MSGESTRGAFALDQRTLFEGLPGDARYAWTEEAHRSVNERCYFYLLSRGDGRGFLIIRDLENVLSELGLSGATFHIIYGELDAQLRIWMSPRQREGFVRAIQSSARGLDLDSVLEFRADSLEYIWHGRSSCELHAPSVSRNLEVVRNKVESLLTTNNPTCDELEEYERSGIILKHDLPSAPGASQTPGSKVFMYLRSPTPPEMDSHKLRCQIASWASEHGLRQVSIYQGSGFCDYLLKGLAPTYAQTLSVVEKLQESLNELGIFGWSHVPADYPNAPERDAINVLPPEAEAFIAQLLTDIDLPENASERILSSLTNARIRHHVSMIMATVSKSDVREYRRLRSVVSAILAREPKEINRRLSFLISIESSLRDLIRFSSQILYGDTFDWLEGIDPSNLSSSVRVGNFNNEQKWLPRNAHEFDLELRRVDMPVLFELLRVLASISPEFTDSLSVRLGDAEWMNLVTPLVKLRDQYAHGLLLDQAMEQNVSEDWWMVLRNLVFSIKFQIGLEGLVMDLESGGVLLHNEGTQ